jgi:hypothetical protein
MKRRAFLVIGGQTAVFGLAPRATSSGLLFGQQQSQVAPDALEQRVAGVIRAYDAQGNHRTGTEVDNASAEWLTNQVRQLGAQPSVEPFTINRVDPQSCYLRIAGRRTDGVPAEASQRCGDTDRVDLRADTGRSAPISPKPGCGKFSRVASWEQELGP